MITVQQHVMSEALKDSKDKEIAKAAKKFYKFKEEMLKRKRPVEFTLLKKESYHKDQSGRLIADKLAPICIPMSATIDVDGSPQLWAYSSRIVPNPELLGTSPQHKVEPFIISSKKITLDPKRDIEKIFYLKFISPFFADTSKGRKYFGFFDKEEEAKKARQEEIAKVEFNNILYSDLYFNETEPEVAKMAAMSLGVKDTDDMGFNELMESIKSTVLAKEANKDVTRYGVQEFIDEVKDGGGLELRSLVYKAKEEGYIKFFPMSNTWSFVDERENEISKIMRVPAPEVRRAEDSLYRHMKDDETALKDLKDMMGIKEKPVSIEDKLVKLSGDFHKLKAFATEKGIQETKKKDILVEIRKKIENNEITIDMFE